MLLRTTRQLQKLFELFSQVVEFSKNNLCFRLEMAVTNVCFQCNGPFLVIS